ncbi:hypothetical protein ABPG74_014286 [Tetrahymena malaccensis]
MEYLPQIDKILAASYFQVILADPYTLKAERTLYLSTILDFYLIKDTNLAIFTLQVCSSNIIDIINLQQILYFDVCTYGTSIFTQNIFSKAFILQNGLALFTTLDALGFQTWSYNITSNQIKFNGYLPITNSTLQYKDIDILENYDILFAVGTSHYMSILKVIHSQTELQFQVLSSMNIQNSQLQFYNVKFLNYKVQTEKKQSLFLSDMYTFYRFDIQPVFDANKNVVQINITNYNNPFTFGTPGTLYTFWYYNKENQQFIIPNMSYYYRSLSFTFIYQFITNTKKNSQYIETNSISKIFQVEYKQNKYFVTVQAYYLLVIKDSPGGDFYDYSTFYTFVKQQPNTFIKVQNCPLCFVTLIQNSLVYFNKVIENKYSCFLNIEYFYGLNLDQINHNVDAYSDGVNTWVLIALPFKYNQENYLFAILNPCNFQAEKLFSTNLSDNINKTRYALYSDHSKQIIGVDSLGNVYAWNSQNFTQFQYKKTITQYQCLESGIGQLYNYGNVIYLIAVCNDYQIISFNIATGYTQLLDKILSVPNQINSLEEIQLLAISDRYSTQIYLYKFNQNDGLFSSFLKFNANQNREEVFNISYLSETQVLWIQYEYSNFYFPIGQCLLNVTNCLKCQMNFYFNTNEIKQDDSLFGLGSTTSPFRTSKSLMMPFFMMQRYSQLIMGIQQIDAIFFIDPTNQMTLYSDLLSISFGNLVNLSIKSLISQNQTLLNASGYINFNSTLQINLENIIFNFSSDSNNQCGLQFNQILRQVLINNVNQISSNNTTTCYSLIVNNSTVVLSNIIISDLDFSSFKNSIIQIKSSQNITLNNVILNNCALNSKFSLLNQQDDVQVIINSASISNNFCNNYSHDQSGYVGQLFQASQYLVNDLIIENNKFCNLQIFSTISSINQQNQLFSFNNIIVQNNQFYTFASYLFFNAIYYFNFLPMHTLIINTFKSFNNTYVPQLSSNTDINTLTTFLFQVNKLQSIQIQNIVVQNQFELAFSTVSQSQYVTLYNISCQNQLDYIQDKVFSNTYAGCFLFNDINSLDLDTFTSSNIFAIDNSILSIINQNQQKSRISLLNLILFNSYFKQTIANTQANPIFISSVYNSNVTIQESQIYNNVLNGLTNSETYSTTGIQVINTQGDITLKDIQLSNSQSDSAYNFLYIQSNNSLITNSTFTKSSFNVSDGTTLFKQQGGCIRIKTNNLIINNSSFSQSTSAIGSFLLIEPLSKLLSINVRQCSFDQGFSSIDGSAIFINSQNSKFQAFFVQSNFTNIFSSSQSSYAISISNIAQVQYTSLNNITFEDVQIQNSFGSVNSAFINPANCNVSMQRIYVTQNQQLVNIPSQFGWDLTVLQQLTLIQAQYSMININNSQFKQLINVSKYAYPLLVQSSYSNVFISNSLVEESNFTQSLIDINFGLLSIKNTKFLNITYSQQISRLVQQINTNQQDNQNSLICLKSSSLEINDNTFFNSISCLNSCQGSSIQLINSTLQINDCHFINSQAYNGGAISITGLNNNTNVINNTNFINNNATNNGGAIYFQALDSDVFEFNIINSNQLRNSAKQYGGGIYITSQAQNPSKQKFQIKNSTIVQNQASVGGGIYNQIINPFIEPTSKILYNIAYLYGENQFSYPTKLYLVNQNNFENQQNQNLHMIVLDNFKSGGTLPEFLFQLKDDNSNKPIISFDNQPMYAQISISNLTENSNNYDIKGNTQVSLDQKQNIFNFSQLSLIGIPGSQSFIKFTSDSIKVFNNYTQKYDANYSYLVQVNFRKCQYGEIISEYSNYQECQTCEDGKYTLDYNGCYDCPEGGVCQEGIINLKQGYWRQEGYSTEIIQCTNRLQNCIGQSYGNQVCIEGHIGPLCEECDVFGLFWGESYSRKSKYECSLCQDMKKNIWKFMLTISWILFSIYMTVQSDKKNQLDRILINAFYKKYSSNLINQQQKLLQGQRVKIYIKILTNYIQIVFSAVTFNLNIGDEIIEQLSHLGVPISSSVNFFDSKMEQSQIKTILDSYQQKENSNLNSLKQKRISQDTSIRISDQNEKKEISDTNNLNSNDLIQSYEKKVRRSQTYEQNTQSSQLITLEMSNHQINNVQTLKYKTNQLEELQFSTPLSKPQQKSLFFRQNTQNTINEILQTNQDSQQDVMITQIDEIELNKKTQNSQDTNDKEINLQ